MSPMRDRSKRPVDDTGVPQIARPIVHELRKLGGRRDEIEKPVYLSGFEKGAEGGSGNVGLSVPSRQLDGEHSTTTLEDEVNYLALSLPRVFAR